jgi:hypothetical protein
LRKFLLAAPEGNRACKKKRRKEGREGERERERDEAAAAHETDYLFVENWLASGQREKQQQQQQQNALHSNEIERDRIVLGQAAPAAYYACPY